MGIFFLNYQASEDRFELEQIMNTNGELGWELVTHVLDLHGAVELTNRDQNILFIFKRIKEA